MYWNAFLPPEIRAIRRANLDGSGTEDLRVVQGGKLSGVALDVGAGRYVIGFHYDKVVCKPPNTRPKQRFSIKGGRDSQTFDCAAGLALGPGDDLKITVTGADFSSSVGGSLVGFQPTKVICRYLTTEQRLKLGTCRAPRRSTGRREPSSSTPATA